MDPDIHFQEMFVLHFWCKSHYKSDKTKTYYPMVAKHPIGYQYYLPVHPKNSYFIVEVTDVDSHGLDVSEKVKTPIPCYLPDGSHETRLMSCGIVKTSDKSPRWVKILLRREQLIMRSGNKF